MFLHKSVGFFRTPTRICVMILCFYLLKKCCKPRLPDRHTQLPLVLRYAAKILYEIMLLGFLCLTKPAFMRRPWRITPCPAVHGWAFLCFVGIISTVSRQLRYSPSRACVCLPPGFLTLWLYLPSCRFASGCCRGSLGVSLVFVYALHGLCRRGSLCAGLVFVYTLHDLCRGLAWICSLSARARS